ncbi:MAG: dTDP-4-dehydrorhamnose 3,5-epimerase [Treponema sp.]|nr:dTDP-4-dehydrorhamnose 3,5-epimerase [Treponema sp.]MBQ6567309.1 dTDP-4-dehydrorhamnose 3,5-epimerase [Treponema sp.]
MAFEFIRTGIEGLYEVTPKVFGDQRGFFLESYSKRDFEKAGIQAEFVQDNMSSSSKGVLRGLHFQKRHPQGKLVSVVTGQVYDVAVDLRAGSPTFGKHYGVVLDADRHNAFYIPAGFAHGFCVMTDTAVFTYKCTDFYHPEDEGGLMWNDPAIGIDWDKYLGGTSPLLSGKDGGHPSFDPAGRYFDKDAVWIGG